MIDILVYNILFWVPYIWASSLPEKILQKMIDKA